MAPEILTLLVWPIATLIIAFGGLFLFRAPLSSLIGRTRKLSLPGVSADVSQEDQAKALPEATENAIQPVGPPPPHEILSHYDDRALTLLAQAHPNSLEMQLRWAVRILSAVSIERDHEVNYRLIFGSQIRALEALNQRDHAALSEGVPYYEEGWAGAPEDHRPTYDDWCKFLFARNLIQTVGKAGLPDPNVAITPLGQGFLMWMIDRKVSKEKPF